MSTWQEQIAEAHAEVIADIKSKFKDINSGPSVVEGVKAFSAAVDWTVSRSRIIEIVNAAKCIRFFNQNLTATALSLSGTMDHSSSGHPSVSFDLCHRI